MDIMSISNNYIDGLVVKSRSVMTVNLFERIENSINNLSKLATPLSAIIGAIIGVVLAIKQDSLLMFFSGLMWILLVFVMYYTGCKLQITCEKTVLNNPISVASQDFIDVLIVFYGALSMISVMGGIYMAIKINSVNSLLFGAIGGFVCFYTVWILLNPSLVTTTVEPSESAGMDGIAILILGSKIFLRSNKLFFGILPTISVFLLVNSLVKSFGDSSAIIQGGIEGAIGFVLVFVGLLSPLFAYTVFLLEYMVLDVMRCILVMGLKQETGAGREAISKFEPMQPIHQNIQPNSESQSIDISADIIKKLAIGALVIAISAAGIFKGNAYYAEYKERSEIERAAEVRKKAEEAEKFAQEEAQKAKEKAEKEIIAKSIANAKRYIGKSTLDFVLDLEINKKLRDRFQEKISVFENYFSESTEVVMGDGIIFGQGCIKGRCDEYKAFVAIDLNTASVYSAVVFNNQIRYIGIAEENAPSDMKKWVLENKPK
jgi:hypothetical protein